VKKALKFRVILISNILILFSAAGAIFCFIKWLGYKKRISSIEYIDIALHSFEEAFSLINKTNLYRNLFLGFLVFTGLSIAALTTFLLILRLKFKKMGYENNSVNNQPIQKELQIVVSETAILESAVSEAAVAKDVQCGPAEQSANDSLSLEKETK
jgi:hypothetical protein